MAAIQVHEPGPFLDAPGDAPAAAEATCPVLELGLPSAMYGWLSQLPAQMHWQLLGLLKAAKSRLAPTPALGTACSGTDLVTKLLDVLDKILMHDQGWSFAFTSEFAAESDEKKQAWIKHHHPSLRHLFGNSLHLSQHMAPCLLSGGETAIIPYVHMFLSGFSCKSRSPMNGSRKRFRNCIQDAIPCETTETFEAAFSYIKSAIPVIAILENVKELLESHGKEASDAEHILGRFRAIGYWAASFVMSAEEFGSKARRVRLYILAVHVQDGVDLDNPAIEDFIRHLLTGMSHGGGLAQLSDFVELKNAPKYYDRIKKSAIVDPKYNEEHMEAYGMAGLRWPPNLQEFGFINMAGMSERQQELAVYLHAKFPATDSEPNFVDINHSMSRLIGQLDAPRNPWSAVIQTLTGQSSILMRWSPELASAPACRLLTGSELMKIIGWTPSMSVGQTADGLPAGEEECMLVSLAGNAFSGFSVAPMMIAGLAIAGATATSFATPTAIDAGTEVDIRSDSSAHGSL